MEFLKSNCDEDNSYSLSSNAKLTRRHFLSMLGAIPLVSHSLLSKTPNKTQHNYDFNLNNTDFAGTYFPSNHLITPDSLKAGDTVAFIAPASPISLGQIRKYVKFFKEKSCNVIICDSIKKQRNKYRYLSAPDEQRAAELNSLFRDPKVKAIICGRGGYGIMRILEMLDYAAFRKYPKILMGYSDITALLLAVYKKSGVITYHGPVASSELSESHKKNIEKMLFSDADVVYSIPKMKVLSNGKIDGRLQGGNLTLISSTLGTDYEINLSNSLLFIEDISIQAYEFDRMMHQILMVDKIETCKGIMFGANKRLTKRSNFYPNRSFTMLEVMKQIAKKINTPIVYNLPFGHVSSQLIFPIGALAELDTKTKTIKIKRNQGENN